MRLTIAVAVSCFILTSISAADRASASITKQTNIRPQPLEAALQQLARDRNLQLIYATDEVSQLKSDGAVGNLSAPDALKQLLQGTGLTYKYLDDNTITVVSPAAASQALRQSQEESGEATAQNELQPQEAKSSSFWDRFRLAQASQGGAVQSASVAGENSEATSQQASTRLEEVVVTAQKRAERLQDVPISIVALTADELAKRNITTIDDLGFAVPGLALQTSSTERRILLRGVGNGFGNATSSLVGIYLDEASVTAFPATQLDLRTYDLERVEVLRGPQGTLYGEGSVGGTVRFITRAPQLQQFQMDADVAALFTQGGAPSQRIQAMLNLPVLSDVLGFRVAGTFDHEGGWVDQPEINSKHFNDQSVSDVRIKGLWKPAAQFSVNALAVIHRGDLTPVIGEDTNGNFTQVGGLLTTPHRQDNYDVFNLTLAYDFSKVRLLNTTTYLKQSQDDVNNANHLPLFGSPTTTPLLEQYWDDRHAVDSLSEELRLSSNGPGPWQYTIGGFYRHFRFLEDFPMFSEGNAGQPLTNYGHLGPYDFQSKSWAGFADTSYLLFDRLTLGAGLRYFHDLESATPPSRESRFHALNPRVYTDLKLSEQLNMYASAAKGFRSGGLNNTGQPTYGPEAVWTYELGLKAALLDRRLTLDTAVFLSHYTDYQIYGQDLNNPRAGSITTNAGDATIKGVEAALNWRLFERWTLSASGDYLKTAFTKIDLAPKTASFAVGDPLDFTPNYQFTVSVQRDFALQGKSGFVRLDYQQQGRSTFRNRSIGEWFFSESDVIHMLNFNASVDWSDTLRLGVFAQNLANDRGYTSPEVIQLGALRARPRTFGVDFSVKFY